MHAPPWRPCWIMIRVPQFWHSTFIPSTMSINYNADCWSPLCRKPQHFLDFENMYMGTYKYDVIIFRNIFTPPPPLSYCIIIWHTSGWCLFDDIILGKALRIRLYPVCCGFLSAKQTCKPYCLLCSKKVRVKYKNIYHICYIYSECAVCDSQDTSL